MLYDRNCVLLDDHTDVRIFDDTVAHGYLMAPDPHAVPVVPLRSFAGRREQDGFSLRPLGDQYTPVYHQFDSRSMVEPCLIIEFWVAHNLCTRLNGQFACFGYGHIAQQEDFARPGFFPCDCACRNHGHIIGYIQLEVKWIGWRGLFYGCVQRHGYGYRSELRIIATVVDLGEIAFPFSHLVYGQVPNVIFHDKDRCFTIIAQLVFGVVVDVIPSGHHQTCPSIFIISVKLHTVPIIFDNVSGYFSHASINGNTRPSIFSDDAIRDVQG